MSEEQKSILAATEEMAVRNHKEEFLPKPFRNEFMRDLDRIMYSKSFRRLSGKTQVFLPSSNDHIRTRLTHTVEVAQISKTVSQNLGLNTDLVEAIAMGHDLGHAPFGHIGERTLNYLVNGCDEVAEFQQYLLDDDKGFKHNHQSVRITTKLTGLYGEFGLNLTSLTNWGILNHTNLGYSKCNYVKDYQKNEADVVEDLKCYLKRETRVCKSHGALSTKFYSKYETDLFQNISFQPWSFEAYVVALSDEIAQRHHDIEDGIITELLTDGDINDLIENVEDIINISKANGMINSSNTPVKIFNKYFKKIKKRETTKPKLYMSKLLIDLYTTILINNSKRNLEMFMETNNIRTQNDYLIHRKEIPEITYRDVIGFGPDIKEVDKRIKNLLMNKILNSHIAQEMDGKGRYIIRSICKAYLTNPRQMYDNTIKSAFRIYKDMGGDGSVLANEDSGYYRNIIDSPSFKNNIIFQKALLRAICDNIAGMTDQFAISQYRKLYG